MKKIFIPQIVIILMLLIAIYPGTPYGYYILLRWVCLTGFCYLTYQAIMQKNVAWIFIFVLLIILYNPISKIFYSREAWTLLDILAIPVILTSIFKLKKEKSHE